MIDFQYAPPESLRRLSGQLKELSDNSRAWMQPIKDAIQQYDILFKPIIEATKLWDDRIKQATASIKNSPSIRAVNTLKSHQYVFWDYLSHPFVDYLLCNPESAIVENESRNDYSLSEELIRNCQKHPYIAAHQCLFLHSVDAYHQEMYDLAAVGFTAVIDAMLSEATNNPTHKPRDRYQAVLDKLMAGEFVADEEYAVLILVMTFNAMAISFYETAPFSEEEPPYLNRNWIIHGRSQRGYGRIDCIKLLRFLYGIILIEYIDEPGIVEHGG